MNVWLSSGDEHQWNPRQKTPATAWEAEIDRLMRSQASALDDKARKKSFDRVQEIVVDELPFIYLVNKNTLLGISPALQGVDAGGDPAADVLEHRTASSFVGEGRQCQVNGRCWRSNWASTIPTKLWRPAGRILQFAARRDAGLGGRKRFRQEHDRLGPARTTALERRPRHWTMSCFAAATCLAATEKQWQQVRGRQIGLVLQSPTASLNPALRIGTQLREAWRAHAGGGKQALEAAVSRALLRVGLPHDEEFRRRYPSQISVGQAQRVLIAMAVMHSPQLLIADEPTSALDAVTQVEILNMLTTLNREMGMAVLYISHDLQSVASVCMRMAILEKGKIVEQGKTESVLRSPRHPYTQRLMSCAPWLQWWLRGIAQRRTPQSPP